MPCVGFILRPQKRPRVLTATLSAAAAARGLSLLALDPDSTPEQWQQAGVDVLVHKAPDETGLDARLQQWAAGTAAGVQEQQEQLLQQQQRVVLLDPPAAVRRLQDRQDMLLPLAGRPLILTHNSQQDSAAQHATTHTVSRVEVSIPHQVVLQPGCSYQEALDQLATSGLQYPVLAKPLVSISTDSARPTPAAAAAVAPDGTGRSVETSGVATAAGPAVAAPTTVNDGHTLGVIFTDEGVQALLSGGTALQPTHAGVELQQQQQQQQVISLPAVLQQYVSHEVLYKLYVIGPSCVLTRRNTITPDTLEAAAAAAPAGKQGVAILPRLSADKLAAIAAAQQQQQSQAMKVAATPAAGVDSSGSNGSSGGSSTGVAVADASVEGDVYAPPLWAVQQLAAHLRTALGLNLFNVDIITPSQQVSAAAGVQQQQQQLGQQQQEPGGVQQQLLVVDINYFPGYDKVPGAEVLFADFLAECAAGPISRDEAQ